MLLGFGSSVLLIVTKDVDYMTKKVFPVSPMDLNMQALLCKSCMLTFQHFLLPQYAMCVNRSMGNMSSFGTKITKLNLIGLK